MSKDAERLKAKIAALRAKTSANGCTEAEALAAAEIAARLMREHGLSEADLVMVEARATERTTRATWRTTLAGIIARVTNTALIFLQQPRSSELVFLGREPWPDVAVYLRDVCTRAVTTEVDAFKTGVFYRRRRTIRTKRQASADFTDGLVLRLGTRLFELFDATQNEDARIEAVRVRDARYPASQDFSRSMREARFDQARSEGWAAGGRVPLSHGVGTPAPRQIPLFEGTE